LHNGKTPYATCHACNLPGATIRLLIRQ
jgi:hypothetical protein